MLLALMMDQEISLSVTFTTYEEYHFWTDRHKRYVARYQTLPPN